MSPALGALGPHAARVAGRELCWCGSMRNHGEQAGSPPARLPAPAALREQTQWRVSVAGWSAPSRRGCSSRRFARRGDVTVSWSLRLPWASTGSGRATSPVTSCETVEVLGDSSESKQGRGKCCRGTLLGSPSPWRAQPTRQGPRPERGRLSPAKREPPREGQVVPGLHAVLVLVAHADCKCMHLGARDLRSIREAAICSRVETDKGLCLQCKRLLTFDDEMARLHSNLPGAEFASRARVVRGGWSSRT